MLFISYVGHIFFYQLYIIHHYKMAYVHESDEGVFTAYNKIRVP